MTNNPLMIELQRQVRCLQQDFDREQPGQVTRAGSTGATIYCHDRCSSCCNLAVFTTLPEAIVIAAALTARQRTALHDYMLRLRAVVEADLDLKSFLRLHRQVIGFCPFLDQGSCSIYQLRPLACRALLSTRPAEWCAADFTSLHPLEQQAFLSSLDPQLVAYPSHYLASSQQLAEQLEQQLLAWMLQFFDLAVSGHLPTLVWLAADPQLAGTLEQHPARLRERLAQEGLSATCLVQFQKKRSGDSDVH